MTDVIQVSVRDVIQTSMTNVIQVSMTNVIQVSVVIQLIDIIMSDVSPYITNSDRGQI